MDSAYDLRIKKLVQYLIDYKKIETALGNKALDIDAEEFKYVVIGDPVPSAVTNKKKEITDAIKDLTGMKLKKDANVHISDLRNLFLALQAEENNNKTLKDREAELSAKSSLNTPEQQELNNLQNTGIPASDAAVANAKSNLTTAEGEADADMLIIEVNIKKYASMVDSPPPKTCSEKHGLQTTKFTNKKCSSTDINDIIIKMCKNQKGGYFGVGGTTANDLAKMLMAGGSFTPLKEITMDTKNYTNTLIDTLNRLIKQVEDKGMVINTADQANLQQIMTLFSEQEAKAIKIIQTLYKLHENSKHLSKNVLQKDVDGKNTITTFDFNDKTTPRPLQNIDEKELTKLIEELSKYKRTEGKLLLACNKLMACINNP